MIRSRIAGLGHYVPERVLTNADLEAMLETSDQWIRDRTGIRERRVAAPDESASTLAVNASRAALADAGVSADRIDLVICGTTTPDGQFPASASAVQHALGASHAGAFDVNAACMGFLSALAAGSQFIAAGSCERVLVIGTEVLSRMVDWKDRGTCVIFGDGAGAVLLEASTFGGPLGFVLHSDGSKRDALYADGQCSPSGSDGPAEGVHYIQMDGPAIFKFAVQAMTAAVREALAKSQLGVDDIDLIVPHQANLRIIQGTAKALGIPSEKVYVNIERYGNTSSASIPIALSEAASEGRMQEGDHVVVCGFGGGLSWGSMVLEWSRTGVEPSQRADELAGARAGGD